MQNQNQQINASPATQGQSALYVLPIPSVISATEMDRSIARASFSRHTHFIACNDYLDAAKVMHKTLSQETYTRLCALNCVYYDKLTPDVAEWVESLIGAIIK